MCGCLFCAPYWGPGPQPGLCPDGKRTPDPAVLRLALSPLSRPSRAVPFGSDLTLLFLHRQRAQEVDPWLSAVLQGRALGHGD